MTVNLIREFIKNHKWAFLLALISGLIIAFPQFYFRYDSDVPYQGIDLHGSHEESFYLNRIKEVQDGSLSLGCPFLKNNKNTPYITPPLGEIITAALGKTFFLALNNTILLARFLFPFAIFLLIYFFVVSFSRDKLAGLTAAALVILGRHLISLKGLWQLLQAKPASDNFLVFFRPVHPQVSSLFFFAFLLFFWLFFIKKQWRWGIASALCLGLSFYLYPFLWMFLYPCAGMFLLILLWQKKFADVKRIGLIVLAGLVIGIPYFVNFYYASLHPLFSEVLARVGTFKTHQPFLHPLPFLLLAAYLLFFSRGWKERYIFSLALILTPFIVFNQQVLTGRQLVVLHFHWYYHIPLVQIFLTIILLEKLQGVKCRSAATQHFYKSVGLFNPLKHRLKLKRVAAFFLIGLSIFNGILIQKASYQAAKPAVSQEQRYGPIISWLNKNTKKEEVVFTSQELAGFVLNYTSLNVQYSPFAFFYLCSSEDYALKNIALLSRLQGLSPEKAKEQFSEQGGQGAYGVKYSQGGGSFSDKEINSFSQKYQEVLATPLAKIWQEQEVKYLVWDTERQPEWQFNQYPFLQQLYQKDKIKIYELRNVF